MKSQIRRHSILIECVYDQLTDNEKKWVRICTPTNLHTHESAHPRICTPTNLHTHESAQCTPTPEVVLHSLLGTGVLFAPFVTMVSSRYTLRGIGSHALPLRLLSRVQYDY